ncbi:MAG: hypothetical protein AB2819_18555, partial [Candidatus Thiodiazotropha endolucinida]
PPSPPIKKGLTGPFLIGGERGFDWNTSFDQARSAAGRRSVAKAPRRGEPAQQVSQSLPPVGIKAQESLSSFLIGGERVSTSFDQARRKASRRGEPAYPYLSANKRRCIIGV